MNTVMVNVRLLGEETPTSRPTQAIPLEGGLYQLLPVPGYDPEDEIWEFLPGAIVRVERVFTANGKEILLAVERVSP